VLDDLHALVEFAEAGSIAEKAFSASSAPWETRRVRVAAHPTPMTAKIGRPSRKKLIIY